MADNNLHYFLCFLGEKWTGWIRQCGKEQLYRKRTKHAQWQSKQRFAFDDALEVSNKAVPEEVRNALVAANRKVLRTKSKKSRKLLDRSEEDVVPLPSCLPAIDN